MTSATYQIDSKWKIICVSETFCRLFRTTGPGLIGRDIRDLMRDDWRQDFRTYVARALVGVGDAEVTLPMMAPCGEQGWYKHALEPVVEDGQLKGYRAHVAAHAAPAAAPAKRWWDLRRQAEPRAMDARAA